MNSYIHLKCFWQLLPLVFNTFDYRQQLNEITHFIDASNVYGSNETEFSKLRDGTTEKMKTSPGNRLPLDIDNDSGCHISNLNPSKLCFKAGDKRANVQPGLSALHTIWVREHNRIAVYLKTNNPGWDDEKVFQEARRFLIAEMQHITYSGFLPKILHNIFLTIFDLKPQSSGQFTGYDNTIKPMIRNAFATAAYRFGHSMLRDHFVSNGVSHQLHTQFNKPDLHYDPQGLEGCTRGLYTRITQKYDRKLTTEITNKLFETTPFSGGDLAAFNIQRGRDHGLPPYNTWLEQCYGSLFKATSFTPGVFGGLIFHSAASAAKLDSAYAHPDDIDLFTGAMSEINLPGHKLGPTFSCILGLQFKALKYGDRFYYEGNAANPFTTTQLDSIRQTTMARVICQNTDIMEITRDVFLEEHSTLNPNVSCNSLPRLELPCKPVTGGWGPWKTVSRCRDVRYCNNPAPTRCGQQCVGRSVRFTCLATMGPPKGPQEFSHA